jgi:ribonucleotide monophosphatase NagD (HAD superfamily)
MVGKPEDFMFFTILEALGMSEDEVMMVGDRWITDIAFAARHGARSVLVLSGIDTEEDLKAVPPELRPTYILPSLVEVASLVEELNGSV